MAHVIHSTTLRSKKRSSKVQQASESLGTYNM